MGAFACGIMGKEKNVLWSFDVWSKNGAIKNGATKTYEIYAFPLNKEQSKHDF